jgi:DNA-nicking Smr family endonuclease
MARLKLDLHPLFNEGRAIDAALERIIEEAERKRIREVEIIPGKGSGQLRRRVLRFLERPDIKPRYHRIEIDSRNHGRLFVHFRWEKR